MKKLQLYIPMLRKEPFSFYIFDLSFRNNTKGALILKFLYFFGYCFLFLTFFLLPIADLVYPSTDKDSAVIKILILFVPISIVIFLGMAILNGKRKFIDPPFFLAVLLFALGTTTSSVLVTTPSLSNTFGNPMIRGLSGISIISFISLFYLSAVYIHNRQLFRRAFKLLIGGISIYLFLNFIMQQKFLVTLDNVTLAIIAFGGFFILLKSSRSLQKVKLFLMIILTAFTLYAYINSKINLTTISFVLIPLLISLVIILGTFFVSKRNFLKVIMSDTKKDLSLLKENKLSLREFIRILFDWLIILSPIVVLLMIIVFNSNATAQNTLTSTLKNTGDTFKNIADLAKDNFNAFLFGGGSTTLSSSKSFIINILSSQGFLGLASYLFIATYSVMVSIRFVYTNFAKGGNYIIPTFLLFILTLIPLEGLFFYPGMKLIYLWWIAFALISLRYMYKDKKNFALLSDKDFKINEGKIFGVNIHRFIKYVVVALLILVALYVSYSFNLIVL